MNRLLLPLLLALCLHASELPDYAPQTERSEGFGQLFDTNESFRTSVGNFDRKLWEEQSGVSVSLDPTLMIQIGTNVFLKTMLVVNVNSTETGSAILGVEKILFGLQIRFEGF